MKYWRENKQWRQLLEKTGTVVIATQIYTAPETLEQWVPYSYAIVQIGHVRYELMSVPGENLCTGDTVACVLRKKQITHQKDVIFYCIKVKKLTL